MQKTIPLFLLILCLGLTAADAYTVVLKNGRSMNGTLISETEDVILFKDDTGVQYSLKKSNLDLPRMTEANAPKIEVPPQPVEKPIEPEPKKKGRVYTKEDVDTLREKYPELSIGEPIENVEEFESGVLRPEAYVTRIQRGASRVNESLEGLMKLRDAAATAWEIAASTGKNPHDAVAAALATEEATLILKEASEDLTIMGRWQETMANPPAPYKDGYALFVQTMTDLSDFQRAVREWNTFENVNLFRSRLGELESRLTASTRMLQQWKPQTTAAPSPAPDATTPTTPPPAAEEETEEEPPLE